MRPDAYDGIYGFRMQEGYNPADYHDVQNLYNLLSPVVFTGNSCSIGGGGAITVKPVDGIYFPPQGADNGLKYFGVTLNAIPPNPLRLRRSALTPFPHRLMSAAKFACLYSAHPRMQTISR